MDRRARFLRYCISEVSATLQQLPPPDVLLVITTSPALEGAQLGYRVSIGGEHQCFRSEPFPSLQYVRGRLQTLEDGKVVDEHRLAGLGSQLTRKLLPRELQCLLWQQAQPSRPRTLQIMASGDAAAVPWELLCLQDPEDRKGTVFLAEAFALTRWIEGCKPASALPMTSLALVKPPDFHHDSGEFQFLQALAGFRVERITGRQAVLDTLAQGEHGGWHFITHASTPADDPDSASLVLSGGDLLNVSDLHRGGRYLKNAPLIFLNACESAGTGSALTGLGGFANAFLQAGAGALIGTLWSIPGVPAVALTQAFYRAFLINQLPIGAAMHQARLAVREKFPQDPTWLAYTVYAHPLAARRPVAALPPEDLPPQPPLDTVRSSPFNPVPPQPPRPVLRWISGALLVLLPFLLFAGLQGVRTATLIHLEVVASRVEMAIGEAGRDPILDLAPGVRALTLTRFSRVELQPAELRWQMPGAALSTWSPQNPVPAAWVLTARGPSAALAWQLPDAPLTTVGSLPLAPGARLVLTASLSAEDVDLTSEVTTTSPLLLDLDRFELLSESVDVQGVLLPASAEVVNWQGRVRGERPFAELHPAADGLILTVSVPFSGFKPQTDKPLVSRPLALTAIEFLKLDQSERVSSLEQGTLTYPDQPGVASVRLNPGETLDLGDLREVRAVKIDLTPTGRLRLVLAGKVGKLTAGLPGHGRDLRLSLAQQFLGKPE